MPPRTDAPAAPRAPASWWRALPGAVKVYVTTRLLRLTVPSEWRPAGQDDGFQRRQYRSYESYVAHQQAKLGRVNLDEYDAAYRRALRERLDGVRGVGPGASVLCLAARLGTEVKAFADLGCFAVGIDLNPGAHNRFVLHGDFHDLQFPDGSARIVFTNSLDHCFDIERLLGEVRRVLAPDGLFMVEAVRGVDEGCQPLFYESFSWPTIGDLVAFIERAGFGCISRTAFEYPWPGEQLCFRLVPAGSGDGTGSRAVT